MPGIEYKIETAADLKALRDTEASLRAQMVAAKAAGKDFAALDRQLKSVSQTIKNIPAPKRMGLEMADMVQGIPVVGNFARALNGLGGPISLAVGGLAALAKGAASAIAAFAGAEAKMAKLDAVLAQNGQLTDGYRAKLQALAAQLQATTAIADDQWLEVLSRLTQFGADSSNIDQYAEAVKNLAGITGGDIVSAAEMFSKAMAGQFEVFGRLGIVVDKTGSQTKRLQSLMSQLAEKGAGVLEAQSRTLSGQWANLVNAGSDLMEAIGNLIARTGILQGVVRLLTDGLTVLQRVFPSLIPAVGGLENKMKTAQQRADEYRQSLRALGQTGKTAFDQFGAAGQTLDQLNARLNTALETSAKSRQAMLDLAAATAEAAAAQVKLDLAKGNISPEQAAAALRRIDQGKETSKIDAAKEEQREILAANQERLLAIERAEAEAAAASQAAQEKAAAARERLAEAGVKSDQAAILSQKTTFKKGKRTGPTQAERAKAQEMKSAGAETYDATKAALEAEASATRGAILKLDKPGRRETKDQKAARESKLRAARQKLAEIEKRTALIDDLIASTAEARSAEEARIAAEELGQQQRPAAAAAAESARGALDTLDVQTSAVDTAATAEKTAAEAEAAHKRRMIDLQIELNEARAKGDADAAARAEQTLKWLQEYKRIWDETKDDALARRAAGAATARAPEPEPEASPVPDAVTSPVNADRLAKIGGFVGGSSAPNKAADATAKNTERTARAVERMAQNMNVTPNPATF